jgi:O-antigen/teichoic acid export membrane protein
VPGLFGEQWRSAAVLLPPACLGLAVAGAVSVACEGYLYAVGDATSVLRSGVLQAAVLFGTALPLLPVLGLRAVGLAWLASYLVEAVALARAAHRHSGARVGRCLAAPTAAGVFGGAAGLLVTTGLGADLVAGLAGGVTAGAVFLLILLLVRRPLLLDCLRFVVSAVRATASGPVAGATAGAGRHA